LKTTDSIVVSWLGGPVLCSVREFVAVSEGLFAQGCLPLLLWIHAEWKPDAHVIHSKGMLQFGAPEVLIAGQSKFSPKIAEYLLEVAYYVLTTDREILEGETIDGPKCTFRIQYVNGSQPGKRTLMLIPVRPS
jgi:hypothetical protein